MIEPEMAFADLDNDIELAGDYLRAMARHVLEHCGQDLEFLNKRVEPGLLATLGLLAERPCRRMTYAEAIEILQRAPQPFEFPPAWGSDLQSEHERYLAEQAFRQPVVVTDFPRELKPFYMRLNDDGRTVAAMDVLVPGVGEIIGGSQREERLELLEARIREKGVEPSAYGWFLDLRRFGTVPHAGFGLGFERLVQTCTGMANIRDVIPFPRTPGSAEF
jgi:asparaginyl-tRNA synthetase